MDITNLKEEETNIERKPTGFVALCKCGFYTGAADAEQTGSAVLLGWLMSGKTVEPRFGDWTEVLCNCDCDSVREAEIFARTFGKTEQDASFGKGEATALPPDKP